ncbi:hypothetical protein [Microbulbifer sp. VAAF005]|uniref:hypothetical protein n=1 Tax=Microbulbifer sp. VAAF005 TaxID=3034230 RepID=UPI0024AE7DC6|nr:hypothetical protein [Microbulbifer sp. VAAF005]WHI45266.1 hypothetical protein P0078_16215 [Microbulbifer sp. VAAF005]
MISLSNQIDDILLEPMKIPDAFERLFSWIEKKASTKIRKMGELAAYIQSASLDLNGVAMKGLVEH